MDNSIQITVSCFLSPRVGDGKGLYVSGQYMSTATRRRNRLGNVDCHLVECLAGNSFIIECHLTSW